MDINSLAYHAAHANGKEITLANDELVVEAGLQININNEAYTVVMRTPGDDFELIRGLLYAEDIYKSSKPLKLEIISIEENGFSVVNANIAKDDLGNGYMNKRTLLSVSSCGICGKQKLEDLKPEGKALVIKSYSTDYQLESLYAEMKYKQTLFKKTGGSHAAALFNDKQQLLTIKEDIGRHNAVDKVIGQLVDEGSLNNAKLLLVSGRVSFEIISKAFIAKIPTVAAVSACSSLAVDFAKEFGICLIGFSRGKKATIYSGLKK